MVIALVGRTLLFPCQAKVSSEVKACIFIFYFFLLVLAFQEKVKKVKKERKKDRFVGFWCKENGISRV